MTRLKELQDEIYRQLGDKAKKSIFIVECGNLTAKKRPWYRTFITDSDQGPIITILISSKWYDDEYRPKVIKAILDGVGKYHTLPAEPTPKTKTKNKKTTRRKK